MSTSEAQRGGPLTGVRIVEIDAIGPVPLAAMLLADWGAEVVRVARPPSAGPAAWDDVGGAVLHRGRKVVHLNLKDTAERSRLEALIDRADGLIEGFRPGVMERLGLGPGPCLARNPRLVYGRMTGWGQEGPLSLRAGHDINYISLTGALHALGDGRTPAVPLNLIGDYGGGTMFLVAGLLAALVSARATGNGQVVDAAIVDGTAALMSLFHAWLPSGLWTDKPANNILDGAAPFYRCYACADGGHVAVGCLEPQFFAVMVEKLGLADRNYRQNDRTDWPRMAADFTTAFAARARDEWAAQFAGTDACVTPVLAMAEAPQHPHLAARGTFVNRNGADQAAPAPRFGGTPAGVTEPCAVAIEEITRSWT